MGPWFNVHLSSKNYVKGNHGFLWIYRWEEMLKYRPNYVYYVTYNGATQELCLH